MTALESLDLTSIIIAIISVVGGGGGLKFWQSWQESRAGRKTEAQKLAMQRDEAMSAFEKERNRRLCWQEACAQARRRAIECGVTDLPPTPDTK